MAIDLALITKLRNQTGAGIADCKEALTEAKEDFDKAIEILRKKGAKIAGRRADKEACEGIVYSYIHTNNKAGAIIELNCETDFVAKNEEFKNLAHDLAMQITAQNPLYVSPEDVPEDVLNKEKEIIKEKYINEKIASIGEKIEVGGFCRKQI